MAPKQSTKQASGLTQPTLSFQSRRPTTRSAKEATGKGPATRKPAATRSDVAPAADAKPKPHAPPAIVEVHHDEREPLDPNSKEWDKLYKEAKVEMGNMPPIHGADQSKVQNILRVFDMTAKYGPCAGLSRLQRWERAKKWGLNPPEEIKSILLTQQGEDNEDLRESVLYGWV